MTSPSWPSQGRGAALAILAGVVLVFGTIFVLPIAILFADQSDKIADARQTIAAYQAEIASRPALEAELTKFKIRASATEGLVRGDSAALAAANIQGAVKTLIENSGGQVRSLQNLPSTQSSSFEKIEIQYDVSIPPGSLRDVIYRLEAHTPYLFLDNVDIRMPEGWQMESALNAPPNLEIRWTVQGYKWLGQR